MKPFLHSAVLLAVAALAVSGCGSGDDEPTGAAAEGTHTATIEMPVPKRPISAEVTGFEGALREESCRKFFPLIFSTVRGRPPGSPPTKAECREEPILAAQYLHRVGPPISRSREYGTGALMEAPTEQGNMEYTVWVVDGDGRFRFVQQEGVFHEEIGTPFKGEAEAERVAEDFTAAVEEHDCTALLAALLEESRLVTEQDGPRETCEAVLDGVYFAPALRGTPAPEVEVLGGTRTFAFVGVPTEDAYFTLTLGRQNGGGELRVADVLPSTQLEPPEA